MPNEFIARNGIIARSNSTISGSFFVSGSIGIGTNNPTSPLHISSTNGNVINATSTAAQTYITFTDSAGYRGYMGTAPGGFILVGNAGMGVYFYANGSPSMNLSSTGNLGVNMGNIVGSARLHISGASSDNLLRVDSPASSSILFVTGSGNVGIGTTSPAYKLDVKSGASNSYFTSFTPSAGSGFIRMYQDSNNHLAIYGANAAGTTSIVLNTNGVSYFKGGNIIIGGSADNGYRLQVNGSTFIQGSGTTSATTAFLIQNSTPANLMTVQDNGQITVAPPILALLNSQSAFLISQSISSSNVVGGQVYGVNITPTFWQTTASQTETAFRVAPTFTQSSVLATSGTNIIADFGATSVGSQLTVTDVTSGSIYMVNDVSGIPIIEATSDWTVNMYNFPNIILQKTGSQVNINGTLRVSGSFVLPLSQSTAPQTGSAYWSGSLLFIWDGTRYRSSSFA